MRSRRERITPEDAGLPGGYRRRTAGLRREEVAQLSGVGVTWYTWLEQGRPIRASVQVLEAVARTLQLDPIERRHLFRLAEVPDTTHPDESGPVLRPQIQVVLDGLSPLPASVVTERFDVLAWNPAYEVLFPRMLQAPPEERNTLLYLFARPECCSAVENRADQRAALVAQLRAAYGHHVGDPAWTGFIRRMEAASPEFAAMWATQDVANPHYLAKVFRHPLYPRLEMTSTSFAVQGTSGHPDGGLHPGQRGHPRGHGRARRGPGPASVPLLARPPGPDPRSSYDLGTSQPEGPHTATRPPRMTVSHQFPRSPREPAITDLQ